MKVRTNTPLNQADSEAPAHLPHLTRFVFRITDEDSEVHETKNKTGKPQTDSLQSPGKDGDARPANDLLTAPVQQHTPSSPVDLSHTSSLDLLLEVRRRVKASGITSAEAKLVRELIEFSVQPPQALRKRRGGRQREEDELLQAASLGALSPEQKAARRRAQNALASRRYRSKVPMPHG